MHLGVVANGPLCGGDLQCLKRWSWRWVLSFICCCRHVLFLSVVDKAQGILLSRAGLGQPKPLVSRRFGRTPVDRPSHHALTTWGYYFTYGFEQNSNNPNSRKHLPQLWARQSMRHCFEFQRWSVYLLVLQRWSDILIKKLWILSKKKLKSLCFTSGFFFG